MNKKQTVSFTNLMQYTILEKKTHASIKWFYMKQNQFFNAT